MSIEASPVWVEWVDGLRRGDASAREELTNYFTPFVHGVLSCRLAAHVANAHVKPALDEVLSRNAEAGPSTHFGRFLLDTVRSYAAVTASTSGATLEMLGGGPAATEGKKVLSKLRHLADPGRERLVFRLLEGITGAEICEVTGAPEAEVRGDLEHGITSLLQETSGLTITATGDPYLWSLIGTPHSAVVPLENQLTPLRYDPSAPDPSLPEAGVGAGISPDVTPVQSPKPIDKRSGEGRRATSPEMKVVKPVVSDDEPGTTPIGVPLVEDPTRMTAGNDSSAQENTRNATDLPVAAQENPFAAQPGTIPVSDLPVAAGIDRASQPQQRRVVVEETRQAPADPDVLGVPGSEGPPTNLRPRTMDLPVQHPPPPRRSAPRPSAPAPAPARREDSDSTAPRGVPLSVLARQSDESYEAPSTGSLSPAEEPGQDWRTSVVDVQPAPEPPRAPPPFSMTRGATPFVISVVLFAFFLAIAYINLRSTERGVRQGWNLVPVVVAATSIPEGTVVDFDMISMRDVPEQFVTASVVKPDSASYILNQKIMVPVQAGDPMLWSQFETSKANERLSRNIQKKARAYTIEAKQVTSVGGWVRPGDHVDLIISMRDENKRERTAQTRLQNVIVLATGKITPSTNTNNYTVAQNEYNNVSILALPEEVEILALMRERASYRMVLRNDEDVSVVEDRSGAGPTTLLSGERVLLLHKKRAETIQMIRGSQPAKQVPAPKSH